MPDEIAVAHERRIGWVNMVEYHEDAVRLLELHRPKIKTKAGSLPRSRLQNLALHCGMPAQEYAQQHSMMAAVRSIAPVDIPYGDPSFPYAVHMQYPRNGAYCCLDCVDQDLQRGPFSWFRRSHHLCGVDWCPVHGSVLQEVDAHDPFQRTPNYWLAQSKLRRLETSHAELPEARSLRRYVEILTAFLKMDRPLRAEDVNLRIQARARERNFSFSGQYSNLLSTLAQARFDKDWYFRSFGAWKGHAIDRIGKSRSGGASGHVYALAMVVLYSTTQEALNAIDFPIALHK